MRVQPERMFMFRLAKELGKTVRELGESLDSNEIAEWLAFFKVEREESEGKQKQDTKNKMQAALSGMAKK
jgi:hypothetical protein